MFAASPCGLTLKLRDDQSSCFNRKPCSHGRSLKRLVRLRFLVHLDLIIGFASSLSNLDSGPILGSEYGLKILSIQSLGFFYLSMGLIEEIGERRKSCTKLILLHVTNMSEFFVGDFQVEAASHQIISDV